MLKRLFSFLRSRAAKPVPVVVATTGATTACSTITVGDSTTVTSPPLIYCRDGTSDHYTINCTMTNQQAIWGDWVRVERGTTQQQAWSQWITCQTAGTSQLYVNGAANYAGGLFVNDGPSPIPSVPSPAIARAKELLDSVLSAEQKAEAERFRYFTVIGSFSKRRYRVHVGRGQHGNIEELGPDDKPVRKLCCAPGASLPEGDHLVGQKLFLEHAEEEFVRTANVTDLKHGFVLTGARFLEQGGLLRAG